MKSKAGVGSKRIPLTPYEFDCVVKRAIGKIPASMRTHLKNILITVRPKPSKEMLSDLGLPTNYPLLGIYQGASLMERSAVMPPLFPDTIFIFQEPVEEICLTIEELEDGVEITVVHEIARYIGLTDEELETLGYA